MSRVVRVVAAAIGAAAFLTFPRSSDSQDARRRSPRIYAHIQLEDSRGYTHQIVAIDPDTGHWTTISSKGGRNVRASKDGRSLAFERDGAIWICSTDGNEEARAVGRPNGSPVWSPDGKHLLCCHEEWMDDVSSWKFTTWRFSLDPTENPRKSGLPTTDLVWDWSPDGKWLVTSSLRDRPQGMGWQLYVMRPDGSEARHLTRWGVNFFPQFSPDAKRIVYTDSSRNKERIKIVDIDGNSTREILLAERLMNLCGVCWSPDGKQLACTVRDWQQREDGSKYIDSSSHDPNYRLLIMDSDGKNPREVMIQFDKGVKLIHLGNPHWR